MGTIEPYIVGAGKRYRVIYRRPDHKQTSKRGFTTKKAAELYLASIEVSKARGEYIEASAAKTSIGDLAPGWLQGLTHLKPSSFGPVETAWRIHVQPTWGARSVGEVQHSEVQRWVSNLTSEKSKSPTVVLRAHGVLAGILDVAVRDRRILANPARGVNLPRRVAKEHRYLTHGEVGRLASNSGKHGLLVNIFAYTGLRWGEAIGLRVGDVDLERRRLNVSVNAVEQGGRLDIGTPKSHKRRAVPIPQFLASELGLAIQGKSRDELVFSDEFGQHMKRTRVSAGSKSWFKTALKVSGIEPMTLHDLRHTAASLAISSGANVKAVQRMLGHASAAMTLDIYADLFDDDLDLVAQALDRAKAAADVAEMLPLSVFEVLGQAKRP
jgi:integrase